MTTVDSAGHPARGLHARRPEQLREAAHRAAARRAARCSSATRPGRPRWTSPRPRDGHPLVAVDVYPGGDVAAIAARIREVLPDAEVIDVEDAAAADLEVIDALIARNLTDDRVFGVMSHFTVDEFYDAERLAALQRRRRGAHRPDRARRLGRRPRGRPPRGRARARRPRPLGDPAAACAPVPRTGAPTTATRTSCASTSAASSSSGAPPTGTSARCSTGSTCSSTATPRSTTAGAVRGADFRAALAERDRRAVPRRAVLRPRRRGAGSG